MTHRFPEDDVLRLGRRALLLGAATTAAALPLAVFAQDDATDSTGQAKDKDKKNSGDDQGDSAETGIAEVPSFGARRPGPVTPRSSQPERKDRKKGYIPVELSIPDAAVDAPVELGVISQEGVMLDPSGAWVVTWYDVLGKPGEGGNVVMAGHLDYWDVPQAVFYYVPNLPAGAPLALVMDDGTVFDYAIEFINLFAVADLTPEIIASQIVGDTGAETLTLITCGGQFDANLQEYLNRWVIRATKV
jgi:sortase (surface protein transpeptidase)